MHQFILISDQAEAGAFKMKYEATLLKMIEAKTLLGDGSNYCSVLVTQ